uniref:Uncharacterized protein n=1 Tax=Lactuca sativa TaxID=4236 RepID=A0A9R1UWK4_LACSA|nr:hypothetical protein LSAT_V11C700352420 [Lactuca sativa]
MSPIQFFLFHVVHVTNVRMNWTRQRFQCYHDQILATKHVPTLGMSYHMVAEDETQRAISLENQIVQEPTAFKAFQRRDNNFRPSKEKYMVKQEKENKQDD